MTTFPDPSLDALSTATRQGESGPGHEWKVEPLHSRHDLVHRPGALDQLARGARRHLVPRHAEIQPMADRFVDLELDPRRRMWVAMGHGRPLGFIDAVLEHPDARSCTIQQVAVSPSHRFRGVGRSMVVVLENAAIEAGIHQLLAFVLSRSAGDFWRAVGFDESRPRLFVRRLEAHARTAPGA